jgi:hypothetical protein
MSIVKISRFVQFCFIAAATLIALAGCATKPDIRLDRDPSVDLSAYKTFAFFEPVATDRPRYSTLLSGHLKHATLDQLQKHNVVYSQSNPDLKVNLFLSVVDRMELRSTPAGRGLYRSRWGSDVETVDYRKGTLVVDLVDARRNALVWRGVAEGRVDEQSIKDPGPAIAAVVREIFANYPNARTE